MIVKLHSSPVLMSWKPVMTCLSFYPMNFYQNINFILPIIVKNVNIFLIYPNIERK